MFRVPSVHLLPLCPPPPLVPYSAKEAEKKEDVLKTMEKDEDIFKVLFPSAIFFGLLCGALLLYFRQIGGSLMSKVDSLCIQAQTLSCCIFLAQKAMEKALNEGKAGVVSVMQAALNYLTYFKKTWIPIIDSWSRYGRVRAAVLVGVEVDKIPTTNNHLEGFNSVLKSSYLARHVVWYCGRK